MVGARLRLLLATFVLIAMTHAVKAQVPTQGQIIFDDAYGLKALNLADGVVSKLFDRPNVGQFRTLSKMSDHELLFDNTDPEVIQEIDLETGAVRFVTDGIVPTALRDGRFTFYAFDKTKEWYRLLLGTIQPTGASAAEINPGPFFFPRQTVSISKDEIIFGDAPGAQKLSEVYRYNIKDHSMKALPVFNCSPVAWRPLVGEFLCEGRVGTPYLLFDRNGIRVGELQLPRGSLVVGYIPETDSLLVNEPGFGVEVRNLYSYDFKRKQMKKLLDRAFVGVGGAIFVK